MNQHHRKPMSTEILDLDFESSNDITNLDSYVIGVHRMINPSDDGNLKMPYPANLYSNKLIPRKDKEEDLKE